MKVTDLFNIVFKAFLLFLPVLLLLNIRMFVKDDYKQNSNEYGYDYVIIIMGVMFLWWIIVKPYIDKFISKNI
jgi:hypothetical protein